MGKNEGQKKHRGSNKNRHLPSPQTGPSDLQASSSLSDGDLITLGGGLVGKQGDLEPILKLLLDHMFSGKHINIQFGSCIAWSEMAE